MKVWIARDKSGYSIHRGKPKLIPAVPALAKWSHPEWASKGGLEFPNWALVSIDLFEKGVESRRDDR